MPEQTFLKQQFNGGAISPWGGARQDVPGVMTGANKMTNFLAKSFGPAYKRAGTEFITSTKNNGVARLEEFNYDADTKFILEIGIGYIRFLFNESLVTLPISPTSLSLGFTEGSYQAGRFTYDTNPLKIYAANVSHDQYASTEPPNSRWNEVGIIPYLANTLYTAGDLVVGVPTTMFFSGTQQIMPLSRCITTHTSGSNPLAPISANFQPLTTTRWDYDGWAAGTTFVANDYVTHTVSGNLRWFKCKLGHVSAAANQPGVGASWTTNWTEYSTIPAWANAVSYPAGEPVVFNSILYFATSSHTSSILNGPGISGSPWIKINGVKPWKGVSTAIGLGEVYYYGGEIYSCAVAHTATTYISSNFFKLTDFSYSYGVWIYDLKWKGSKSYVPKDVVSFLDTSLYVCVKPNDPTEFHAKNGHYPFEPEDGGIWQKLGNVSLWRTSTSYVVGQYVYGESTTTLYKVLIAHTSSSIASDVSSGKLQSGNPYILEIATDYTESDLFDIGFLQVGDVIWVIHPKREMRLLLRGDNSAWALAYPTWDCPPLLDDNVDDNHTLKLAATTGDSVIMESSKVLFEAGHVGGFFVVGHTQSTSYAKKVLSANGSSTSFKMSGRLDIYIYGTTWVGDVLLEYSYDNVNWYQRRSWTQPVANIRTVATNTTFDEEVWVRVTMANRTAGGASDYAWIEAADARINGLVRVLSVQSKTRATVRILKPVGDITATTLWSEGAFSDYRGHASCGTLHEARIVLAGGGSSQTFYMSGSEDFYNFTPGTSETSSVSFYIASKDSNAIQWLESVSRVMAIGTIGEVWTCSRSTESKIISALNPPLLNRESNVGSYSNGAVLLADSVVFVRQDGLAVQRFAYQYDQNKWGASDISEMSEHLLKSGIKQLAVTRQPDTMLFAITNDGRLLTMLYNPQQSVVAWSEHTTEGTFESVAVTYGGRDSADEVSLVVKRNINGTDVRYIEQFHPATMKLKFDGDEKELCYLDCSKLKTGASSVTVTGLTHLVNEEVYALADGIVRGPFTVSGGGELTLPVAATKVRVGKIFTSELQGVRLEDAEATIQGNNQMLNRVVIRTYQSNGFELSSNPEDSSIPWSNGCGGNISDVAQRSLVITDHRETIDRRTDDSIKLTIRSSKPLPVCILAIIYKLDVTEV